ncbi:MAG: DNA-packaging protein [Vibrio sp.]
MAIKKKLWEMVKFSNAGRPPLFSTPEDMWGKASEYFEWVEENSLIEEKLFSSNGELLRGEIAKMRVMSIAGLCLYLNISESSWHNYKNKDEFLEVTRAIDHVMYEQKFSGAAAGLFQQNIIARDLGLADNQKVESDSNVTAQVDLKGDINVMGVIDGFKRDFLDEGE